MNDMGAWKWLIRDVMFSAFLNGWMEDTYNTYFCHIRQE